MPTVLESLENFFHNIAPDHNGPDLIARWTREMETQVNVSRNGGEPVARQRGTYSDGSSKWWNIRVPKGSADNPE